MKPVVLVKLMGMVNIGLQVLQRLPILLKILMIQYLNPHPSLLQHHSHHTWVVMWLRGSVPAGRKSYKLEKYDGSTDWTDYLKHFEIVPQWNGWSDLEKAAHLSMGMKGVARQTWSDIFSDPSMLCDYRSLVKGMGQCFKPEGQEETYKAEFRCRVKQKEETFLEYGYCLCRLAIRAFQSRA